MTGKPVYIVLATLICVAISYGLLKGDNRNQISLDASTVDISALLNGESETVDTPIKTFQRQIQVTPSSTTQSEFNADIARTIADRLIANEDEADRGPSLDEDKNDELLALKARFGSTQVSDIKYDQLGRVRSIYDSISIAPFDHNNSQALGEAISDIGQQNPALFGLGSDGEITESRAVCSNDICATKLIKSFYGLPAWDHEITVNSKGDVIYAVTGEFYEPRLPAPRSYALDENTFREAISQHFSVDSSSIQLSQAGELGIAKLGDLDYYAIRLQNVSVDQAPYDIYIDAESGNVAKASTLIYNTAVTATGTALDGSVVSFKANQEGSTYQMVDSRFPLNYQTGVYQYVGNTPPQLVTSNSPNSGWPASAVSALSLAKDVVDYYKVNHNYDAVNQQGANLSIVVDWNNSNASFWPESGIMAIGVGAGIVAQNGLSWAVAEDVIAHEITHGVIGSTSNLDYAHQSGALNESFADFFGAMLDSEDWLIGEDLLSPSGMPLRNMANPADSATQQPFHYSEYQSLPNTEAGDHGGVHRNSGIPNRALYLLADGLSAESLGTSIGRTKTAELAFQTMIGLNRLASFDEAAELMISLASQIYGANSEEHTATELAWQSVGLPQSTIVESSITGTPLTPEDVTLVAYLKPFFSTSLVSPDDNVYDVYVQAFANSSPEFIAEVNLGPVNSSFFAQNRRPTVATISNQGQSELLVLYQRVDGSFYVINDDFSESFIDDGASLADLVISQDGNRLAIATKYSNIVTTVDIDKGNLLSHEVSIPSTIEGGAPRPVDYIDTIRFDPTGRFLVLDFLTCSLTVVNCDLSSEGYWSIAILDVVSGEVEFPFPSQPSRFDVGFPAFSNLTDRYIAIDIIEHKENSDVVSGVYIYDRDTGELPFVVNPDLTTNTTGAFGRPSFSSDDSSIVFSASTDSAESMFTALLSDYQRRDVASPFILINPYFSFKSYAATFVPSDIKPVLTLSSTSLGFSDMTQGDQSSLELCLENEGSFPIDVYDTSLPVGFEWNGDNSTLANGSSVCSPVTLNTASLDIGSFSTAFSILHNGANSPTPVSLTGFVDIDTDGDGIGDNTDSDIDGDGVINNDDLWPLDKRYSTDSNSDGMPDAWEAQFLDPSSDAADDHDNDGLTSLEEFLSETNPNDSDSDQDTLPDGWELENARDPTIADYIVATASSGSTNCAVDDNGLICWGLLKNYAPNTNDIKQLAIGALHGCHITTNDSLECWGLNGDGNLDVPVLSNPTKIVAGEDHTCVLDSEEVVCWGRNTEGQTSVPALDNPTDLFAGFNNTCAVDDSGTVCWGEGFGNVEVSISGTVLSMGLGKDHACAVFDSITGFAGASSYPYAYNTQENMACWGHDGFGQITDMVNVANAESIGSGYNYSCAMSSTEVSCWGFDWNAHGTEGPQDLSPELASLSVGTTSNCLLSIVGVQCWGRTGTTGQLDLPVLIFDPDDDGFSNQNGEDLFPLDPSEWNDNDADGIGDNTDPDDDNDGLSDNYELANGLDKNNPDSDFDTVDDATDAFPLNDEESIDTDGNGVGNNADTDDDGDDVADLDDAFPLDSTETLDTDMNGVGNNVDTDDDGDGFSDEIEIEAGFDPLDARSRPTRNLPSWSRGWRTVVPSL